METGRRSLGFGGELVIFADLMLLHELQRSGHLFEVIGIYENAARSPFEQTIFNILLENIIASGKIKVDLEQTILHSHE